MVLYPVTGQPGSEFLRELLIHSCDVGRPPADLQRDFPTLSFTHLADCWWHQGPQNDDGIAVEPEDVFLQRMAKFAQDLPQIKERPLAQPVCVLWRLKAHQR